MKTGILNSYEVLNLRDEPCKSKWTILPMNNSLSLNVPRVYCGIIYDYDNQEFIFIGGCSSCVMDNYVVKFSEENFNFWRGNCIICDGAGFTESSFIKNDDGDYYQFSYEDLKVYKYTKNCEIIKEVAKEWTNID